jgi:hypothetical protein
MSGDPQVIVQPHECVKDESFKEMTSEFKELSRNVTGISTDLALIKRDVGDLKLVTVTMSKCIEALTASSIKAGENNITKGQFYSKIDELNKARTDILEKAMKEFHDYVKQADAKFKVLEDQAEANKDVCDDYSNLKKWVMGVVAAMIIFLLGQGYLLLVHKV